MNLDMFARKIKTISESTDLIILPEMFSTGFTMNANKVAEKMDGSAVHKYVRVTKNVGGDSNIMFEHFDSPETLTKEKAKFLGLAQKLGVKIEILEHRESGHPIEAHHVHKHFLKDPSSVSGQGGENG